MEGTIVDYVREKGVKEHEYVTKTLMERSKFPGAAWSILTLAF
jgi:hypothetical protein